MNDDLEPRLRDALHSGSLPPAPATLLEALERVPDARVRARSRRGGWGVLGLLAAAGILVVASAVALTGGSTPRPGPAAQSPAPSTVAGLSGLRLVYTAQAVGGVAPKPADMAAIASILRTRIEPMGVAGATVTTHDLVIVVDLPGVTEPDADAVRKVLGQTGKVEFVPLGDTQGTEGEPLDLTKYPPLFGGDQISSARVGADQNGNPAIDLVFKADGARLFADYTAAHVGSYFAITLDGVVVSAPVIQNAITGGEVEITGAGLGGFGADTANGLVAVIRSGTLPFPIVMTSASVVELLSAEPSVVEPKQSAP